MNPVSKSPLPRRLLRAYTLVETMISLALLGVGSIMLYETYETSMFMVDKNVSMNESNTNLQWAYYKMLTALEGSASFVDCANFNSTTQTFTPVAAGTWGNAVRFETICPITLYVMPDDSSGYTISNPPPPTRVHYLNQADTSVRLTYNTSLYSNAAAYSASSRLLPTYPALSGSGTSTQNPGVQPGIAFDSANTATPGVVTLTFTSGINANILDCNRAYFIQESAFVVTTSPDGHRSLLFMPDCRSTSVSTVVCRDLDGGNQSQPGDTTIPGGGTPGIFCIPNGTTTVQVLLPVRSQEFLNVMSRAGGSAARNNTWVNVNCKLRDQENPL